jgi:uncharacterized protein YfaP (DUF2135 family)
MNKIIIICLSLSAIALAANRQSGKIMGSGTGPATFVLTEPKSGWTQDRMVKVEGTISDHTINPVTVVINGDRYLLRTNNGSFSRKFPITAGKNSVVVQGTNKAGTFKAEKTLFAQVSPVSMMVVLTSDTDGVYTDLHIYEPNPDTNESSSLPTEHVYWARTKSKTGGIFYLNEQGDSGDEPGYGPYLYTHTSPPLGIFRIDSNYWPSGDKAHTVGTLNLVLFGGTPQEIRRTIKSPLAKPGETVTMAWIKIEKGQKAQIYSPSMDDKPKDNSVWPASVINFVATPGSNSEDE